MVKKAWNSVALLLALACMLAAPATAADAAAKPTRNLTANNALERGVLGEMNALRKRHGLRPLRLSSRLSAAANAHSLSMARNGFFAHESADGSAFWRRVERFYGSKGYPYWSVGENLLWSSPDVDPAGALKMWMDSPPHRKNLLTARWREVGLSAVHVQVAPGIFNGLEVTIVTADFGVRR